MTSLNRKPIRGLVIAVLLIILFQPVVAIPFRVVLLACAALVWTFLEARSLNPIGLSRHGLTKTLAWAVGIAVGVTALGYILEPVINKLLGIQTDLSGYGALKGNAQAALKLLMLALTSAAFGEEILFRGFLQHQVSAILGSGDRSRWTAILASGALFGLAHSIQGPAGVISTGLAGLVFGWAWFRSGRNLWALILAHGMIDSYGIAMLYLGRSAI
ncbi:type II CAAX endopeptidase family protein [Sphingomonas sp. UV9]|uniref:CPBP family intramembrane glutamic endopeptidase n=1 Tax=Sphingomonas sp. UV9 TaxID=1851410 RepID=UPI0013E8B60C|nr:type II CAAX endopeptidase family protein [Sphingomonas sp. UV9]